MSLQEKLESLKEVTLSKIKESRSINELNQIRVDVLGKGMHHGSFAGNERVVSRRASKSRQLCQ